MTDIHKTIEAVWKIESIRLIAAIARVTQQNWRFPLVEICHLPAPLGNDEM